MKKPTNERLEDFIEYAKDQFGYNIVCDKEDKLETFEDLFLSNRNAYCSDKDIYDYLEKMKSEIKQNGCTQHDEEIIRTYIGIYQLRLMEQMFLEGSGMIEETNK